MTDHISAKLGTVWRVRSYTAQSRDTALHAIRETYSCPHGQEGHPISSILQKLSNVYQFSASSRKVF